MMSEKFKIAEHGNSKAKTGDDHIQPFGSLKLSFDLLT